ncbi:hypothetical protein OESDEN_03621 [Oesophagostomum dentatum]|uniref:Uncharacterized protein n=1 Tax=Oesophagostomum dentatum TaxID=61180 RepID=A0A0B1TKQ0_OESDE|nr:hypothetical protein OESDEN_03621 [Oesophagostomum dentatum]
MRRSVKLTYSIPASDEDAAPKIGSGEKQEATDEQKLPTVKASQSSPDVHEYQQRYIKEQLQMISDNVGS